MFSEGMTEAMRAPLIKYKKEKLNRNWTKRAHNVTSDLGYRYKIVSGKEKSRTFFGCKELRLNS